jgi:hypothetical protein
MEKPVRVIENEKIRSFNEKVRNGLEHALNFMLTGNEGGEIQISYFEPFLMPIAAYLQVYQKQSVLIRIHSDHDYKGELYWFFELKTAVILGALMRLVPINSLAEKLAKGDFDATDQDSFGEVGNQLAGILDRAFRSLTNKNIHLRMDFKKVVYPSAETGLANFRNEEEYLVLLATVTIPVHGGQKLTLLLPRSLYEVMLNLEIALEGIEPKKVLLSSWDEALVENTQTEMNSRHTKVLVISSPEDVITAIDQPDIVAVGLHLKKIAFPLTLPDTIFFKRLAANRALMRTPYFLTWEGATDEQVKELAKLGLLGSTSANFAQNFSTWAQAFTQDPSRMKKP